eukprot:CAMPEP_0204190632 /NCGR_PEP_ID=MMETSP0361-20130328/59460_1 /ASSEMBLY_ACC=CAM_ASM_000343 /TAXON_ID=268821 /ORGANISM="Scrippsiella Hangoei, Strain SHTV-5" /LENGTH=44 /DNA_ID= /DNA_START= /DNA_END= /DNA_ORIENTATION=
MAIGHRHVAHCDALRSSHAVSVRSEAGSEILYGVARFLLRFIVA